jgi:hypothetical protein
VQAVPNHDRNDKRGWGYERFTHGNPVGDDT